MHCCYDYCPVDLPTGEEFILQTFLFFFCGKCETIKELYSCSCILHTLYGAVQNGRDENPFSPTPPASLSEPVKVREIYVAHSDINTRVQSMQIGGWRKLSALWRLSLQLGGKQHSKEELCHSLTNGLAVCQRTSGWISWKYGLAFTERAQAFLSFFFFLFF